MKPEVILQSDLFDILFESRNKSYGAYAWFIKSGGRINYLTCPASSGKGSDRFKISVMQDDSQDGRTKGYILMRTLMDVGMGIIYIGVSIFILFAKRFGFSGPVIEPPFAYVLAGILIVYGGFRIYRGVKKNYFRS